MNSSIYLLLVKIWICLYLAIEWTVEFDILTNQQLFLLQMFPLFLLFLLLVGKKFRINTHDATLFLSFPLLLLVSALINASDMYFSLMNMRWIYIPYAIFLILINLPLNESQLKNFLAFLLFLSIAHIPVAFFKYFVFGLHGETTTGLIGHSGSTIFICILASFLLVFIDQLSFGKIIFFTFGILLVAIASGKRAVVFLVPLVVVYYFFVFGARQLSYAKALRMIAFFALAVPLFIYAVVRLSPTLNPDNIVGGRFDLGYTIAYADFYTDATRTGLDGMTVSRAGTTVSIFSKTIEGGLATFLFGFGPDALAKAEGLSGFSRFDIEYGVNGFSWLLVHSGVIGLFIWFRFFASFIFMSIKQRNLSDPFWSRFFKGLHLSGLVVTVIMFPYSAEYKNVALMPPLYALLAVGVVIQRRRLV